MKKILTVLSLALLSVAVGQPVKSSLGARGAMNVASEEGGWAKPYVTDGLIAMWDGEWNAGGGLHDDEAVVWKDLAGDFDLTIYGQVEMNCIRTTSTAAAESEVVISGIRTIEVCHTFVSSPASQGLLFYSGPIDSFTIGLAHYGKDVGFQTFGNMFFSYPSVHVPQSCTVSATVSSCYVNGVEIPVVGHSADNWSNGSHTGIGGRQWQNSWKTYGDYFCVRIYSRELSEEEILRNYSVDRARFNLP